MMISEYYLRLFSKQTLIAMCLDLPLGHGLREEIILYAEGEYPGFRDAVTYDGDDILE